MFDRCWFEFYVGKCHLRRNYNDVYDFTSLRENEMMIYSGMNMEQLQNYAYCVSPQGEHNDVFCGSDSLE
ncbi:hypothetical protein B9Z55_024054 [Caenorhabditis nigoni]|uniref:Uncharacterized protein n=1 Tax=Caenorhabditis nigoni TaxID=1611254 RepID=A0A2G5SSI2_9PELO|nr:hypothetical protein B9Z55_024054 [Caenorhabditis nigoni]